MPDPPPLVSVIIACLRSAGVIRGALDSLAQNDAPPTEVIVVSNGATDGTPDIVACEYPHVRLIRLPRNLGYAGGINEGVKVARGEILVPLNDDTISQPTMLRHLVQPLLDHDDIGIVGAKILDADERTIQHAGAEILANACTRHFGRGEKDEGQYNAAHEVDYVSGCVMAIRRRVFEQLGLFDDRYGPAYYEEVELAVRARRAGWRVRYEPKAVVVHLESRTARLFSHAFFFFNHRSRWRFILKNFTLRQMLSAVVPELRYLRHRTLWSERLALLRAYLYVLVRLPMILHDRSHRFLPLAPLDSPPPQETAPHA